MVSRCGYDCFGLVTVSCGYFVMRSYDFRSRVDFLLISRAMSCDLCGGGTLKSGFLKIVAYLLRAGA